MKDEALRHSILITATSYMARRDHDGDLIANVLNAILRGAELMDEALAVTADKPRKARTR